MDSTHAPSPVPSASNSDDTLSGDELVALVKRLARSDALPDRLFRALQHLDSRAVALLLKDLSKAGLDERAIQLFDWLRALPDRHMLRALCDVYTYTAMISLCIYQQNVDRAMELLDEMRQRGVERNVHTYTALMNVCIKSGKMPAALDIFNSMRAERCTPNVVTYNTLIDVYGKLGQWERAAGVIKLMRSEGVAPALRTYNTLIIACNMCNQPREALAVYQDLLAESFAPNSTTYNALISAYGKLGQLEKVLEVYKDMVWKGLERSVITYSSLISACEKAGRWETALQLFDEMIREGCTPNTVTFNSLITACGQGCQWEKAQAVFEQMQSSGCTPDVVTYTSLISANERGGQWHLSLQAFERMLAQGCKPDVIVYNAIIDALWQTGVIWAQAKALELYKCAVSQGHFRAPRCTAPSSGGPASGNSTTSSSGSHSFSASSPSAGFAAAAAGDGGGFGSPSSSSSSGPHFCGSLGTGRLGSGGLGAHGGCGRAELNLHALTSGVTMLSLYLWLLDIRDTVASCGEGALPGTLAIITDPNNNGKEQDPVSAMIAFWDAPFKPSPERPRALECSAAAAARWALSGSFGAMLSSLFPAVAAPPAADARSLLAGESAARTQCQEAFAAVSRFEANHRLQLAGMGAYLGQRTALVSSMLEVGTALGLEDEVVHDGVLLLDRTMSAAQQVPQELLPLVSAAALHLSAAQGGASAGASAVAAAAAAGVDADALGVVGWRVQQLLGGDTLAISAMRCLKVYLERTGYRFLSKAGIYAVAGLPIMLAVEALFSTALLNCRPSAVAAAILYAERKQRGAVPFWPRVLAKMTGYDDLASPELAVAIHAAQKLCRKDLYTQIYKAQAAGLAAAAAAGARPEAPLGPGAGLGAAEIQQQQQQQLWAAPAGLQPLQEQELGAAPAAGEDAPFLLESLALSLSSLGLGGEQLSAASLGAALQ